MKDFENQLRKLNITISFKDIPPTMFYLRSPKGSTFKREGSAYTRPTSEPMTPSFDISFSSWMTTPTFVPCWLRWKRTPPWSSSNGL